MYLPEAIWCMATVTLKSRRLRDEERAKDPDEKDDGGCTHTIHHCKRPNKSHYTEAIRASKLHNLLSCHHWANGKSIHMPVGDIPKVEKAEKAVHDDQVPAFNTCCTTKFFRNRRKGTYLLYLLSQSQPEGEGGYRLLLHDPDD